MRTYLVLITLVYSMAAGAFSQVGPQIGTANASDQQSTQNQSNIAVSAAPVAPQSATQSLGVFSGSGRVDKLVPQVLDISIVDAIDRGIRHNLGLLLSQEQTQSARAAYRRALSSLLPNISGRANDSVQQINLAAFGIPLPAGLKSPLVGPFNVIDARAVMTETFLDFSALNRVRQSTENEKTVKFTVQDARELVVLVVGNQYLLTLAAGARLDTAKAQLTTADTIFRQTQDLKNAGVAAGIDVLRAQVQMQTQQQRVLAADDQYQQQRMALARIIGLPVGQQYRLTDAIPYAPLQELDFQHEL